MSNFNFGDKPQAKATVRALCRELASEIRDQTISSDLMDSVYLEKNDGQMRQDIRNKIIGKTTPSSLVNLLNSSSLPFDFGELNASKNPDGAIEIEDPDQEAKIKFLKQLYLFVKIGKNKKSLKVNERMVKGKIPVMDLLERPSMANYNAGRGRNDDDRSVFEVLRDEIAKEVPDHATRTALFDAIRTMWEKTDEWLWQQVENGSEGEGLPSEPDLAGKILENAEFKLRQALKELGAKKNAWLDSAAGGDEFLQRVFNILLAYKIRCILHDSLRKAGDYATVWGGKARAGRVSEAKSEPGPDVLTEILERYAADARPFAEYHDLFKKALGIKNDKEEETVLDNDTARTVGELQVLLGVTPKSKEKLKKLRQAFQWLDTYRMLLEKIGPLKGGEKVRFFTPLAMLRVLYKVKTNQTFVFSEAMSDTYQNRPLLSVLTDLAAHDESEALRPLMRRAYEVEVAELCGLGALFDHYLRCHDLLSQLCTQVMASAQIVRIKEAARLMYRSLTDIIGEDSFGHDVQSMLSRPEDGERGACVA